MQWTPVLPSISHAFGFTWQMIFEWNAGTKYGITGLSRVAEPWNPSAAPTLFPGLTPFKGGLSGVSRKDPGAPCVERVRCALHVPGGNTLHRVRRCLHYVTRDMRDMRVLEDSLVSLKCGPQPR